MGLTLHPFKFYFSDQIPSAIFLCKDVYPVEMEREEFYVLCPGSSAEIYNLITDQTCPVLADEIWEDLEMSPLQTIIHYINWRSLF